MLATFVQQVLDGPVLGGSYALVVIGSTLILGVLDLRSLAHDEVAMIGSSLSLTLCFTAMSQAAYRGGRA